MTKRREVGIRGEDAAVEYLEAAGYRVVERNWRCARGEIDIVAVDGDTDDVVVVEVKARRGLGAGHPFEAVTPSKIVRLRALASAWASAHSSKPRGLRIDVVGVTVWPDGSETIQHLQNADA